jgi:tRNA pseudouridine38-40 synthase
MIRYFFHIAYNGANYRGWQRQSKVITIQEIIEKKLKEFFKYDIPCLGCGRTDAGVHAAQYFFHIDLKETLQDDLKFILNKMLPKDISVLDIIKMDGEPHAQFDATERTYDYFIHKTKNPFLSDFSSFYLMDDFDLTKIKEAISIIPQYKDFRAFCKTPDRHNNTICNVKSVKLFCNQNKDRIRFQFISDKYLKSMIRIIVYKLIEIGTGKLSIEEFETQLKSKGTPQILNLAYPQGLYLSKVTYPFLDLSPNEEIFDNLQNRLDNFWQEI